jgi:phage gp36-like protein
MATPYASVADLTTYGIPAAALSGVDPAALQAAVTAACGRADSYLRNRYTLPLTAWDPVLTENVCWIAAWNALRIRGFSPDGIDEVIRDGYKDAIAWLTAIATGKVTPVVTDSAGTPRNGGYAGPFTAQAQLSGDATDDQGNPGLVASYTPRARGFR